MGGRTACRKRRLGDWFVGLSGLILGLLSFRWARIHSFRYVWSSYTKRKYLGEADPLPTLLRRDGPGLISFHMLSGLVQDLVRVRFHKRVYPSFPSPLSSISTAPISNPTNPAYIN